LRIVESVKRLFGGETERKSVSLTDPLAYEIFGATPTIAGPAVNAATALRVPAVYSAIALITGAIGSLPAKVYSFTDHGGKRAAKDHPAYRFVHDEANDWTSAAKLRSQLTADALLHDHGFAFANRVNGIVQEFIRLDPRSVTIKTDETTGEPFYVVGKVLDSTPTNTATFSISRHRWTLRQSRPAANHFGAPRFAAFRRWCEAVRPVLQ
jgi:phage portal protein BeeE